MHKKRILICLLIIFIILIIGGCIIVCNGYLKKSKNSNINLITGKKDADIITKKANGIEYTDIQLEYLSYPEMQEVDILILNHPINAAYCKITAELGNVYKSKIYLDKEKQITYYVPDNLDNSVYDIILFEFYDEYSQFIKDSKITIEYDKTNKQFQVIEMDNV